MQAAAASLAAECPGKRCVASISCVCSVEAVPLLYRTLCAAGPETGSQHAQATCQPLHTLASFYSPRCLPPHRCRSAPPSARSATGPATKRSAGRPPRPAAAAVRRQQQPAISLRAGKRLASLPAEDANAVYSAIQRTRLALGLRKRKKRMQSKAKLHQSAPQKASRRCCHTHPASALTGSPSAGAQPGERLPWRGGPGLGSAHLQAPPGSAPSAAQPPGPAPAKCGSADGGREPVAVCVGRKGTGWNSQCVHLASMVPVEQAGWAALQSQLQPAAPTNNLTCCSCRLRVTSRKLSSRSRRSERQP